MDQKTRDLVVFLLVGLAAGFLAQVLIGGSGGLIRYLILGVIGSFVGPAVLGALNVRLNLGSELAGRIASATVGAIIVVIVASLLR